MSKKFACVFPGQGAQFVGMGKEFFDKYETSKNAYAEAETVLGFDVAQICFNGPENKLKETKNTQPCMLVTEIAMLKAFLENSKVLPCAVAGHSLGEYAAMYCAGVLSFEDTLKAIQKRAIAMSKVESGTMAAVLSSDIDLINNCLEDARANGVVTVANYNSLKQVVITGENFAMEKAIENLTKAGVKRVIPLAVSGAFHSPLMKDASLEFKQILNDITINNSKIPVYTNVDAMPETKAEQFKIKMEKQIYSSVYWTQTIQNMVKDGVEAFVEIGPGQVLSGLIRKTIPDAEVYNIFDEASFNDTINVINEKFQGELV